LAAQYGERRALSLAVELLGRSHRAESQTVLHKQVYQNVINDKCGLLQLTCPGAHATCAWQINMASAQITAAKTTTTAAPLIRSRLWCFINLFTYLLFMAL